MAWARVGSAYNEGDPNDTITYTATNGNLVIAVVAISGSAPTIVSVKDNHANALTSLGVVTYTIAGLFGQMGAFAYLATGSPTSFVITGSLGAGLESPDGIVAEFSGVTATTDGTFGKLEFSGTGSTGQPAYSSTASNELLVSFYGDDGNGQVTTAPVGWTADPNNQLSSTFQNIGLAWKNSTGGSETGAAWSNAAPGADGGIVLGAFTLPGGGGSTVLPPARVYDQAVKRAGFY